MISKKYAESKKMIDPTKYYTLSEAVKIIKETCKTKFDSSIDIAIKLNLDTTKADQQLRGSISLPNYVGKKTRILAISDELNAKTAAEIGADFFGGNEKIAEIKNGWMDFDMIITTPKFMPELSKLGKILGPKGLMPNPKLGTVTTNLAATIKEFKKGKSQYRTDTYGNIHMLVGKVSTADEKIIENINTLMDFIKSKRPSTVKGDYIQGISLSSTMGPGLKIIK